MRPILLALLLLLATAAPAAAGGQPRFVTETNIDPPWTGCAFASAAMWLEATHGRRVSWERIARHARSPQNGATIGEIAEAVGDILGRRVRYSPGGGDNLRWSAMVDRLRDGAGVVLFGSYGAIGEPYVRWDRRFAARDDDGHAIYLDRLSADGERVYVMDPLGRGGYDGEWVPLRRVAAFAWRHPDGWLFAIAAAPEHPSATPAPTAAPMESVAPSAPLFRIVLPVRGGFGPAWGAIAEAELPADSLPPLDARVGQPASPFSWPVREATPMSHGPLPF